MCPVVGIKSSPITANCCPKSGHISFCWKNAFQNAQSHQIFRLLLLTGTCKNRPIWSHCSTWSIYLLTYQEALTIVHFQPFFFSYFWHTHTQLSPFLQIEKTHFKFYLTLSLSSILSKMPFHIILVVCPLSFCPILSYRGSCKILKLFIMLSKSH